ncbi:Uncharacterized protein SCF082_LOCUS38048 [Durusdinium trenchii]|uniref:Transposase n=1 Tax=Durusdinium trenchii TaxID=1381693 RepID=A0ABP0PUU4_9DINO
MICDPRSGRILNIAVMHEPEQNEDPIHMLQSMLWLYPKADCFVYDRACSLKPSAEVTPGLKQIQYYIVDKFHAYRHGTQCVNTNLAEQVFAWFKNYAPVINEMRENRHRFLLLWLAKRHNDALLHGSASYLRSIPNSKSKTTSKSYNCSKNKKTPKGKKVKKTTMKGMKVKKVMKGMKVKGMKVKNVMKAMK